jgi:hypothetical protein
MPPSDANPDNSSPYRQGASPSAARRSLGGSSWTWAAIACVLLGASGVVQAVQNRRHADEKGTVEACPFPLASIPSKFGVWRLVEGGEKKLDDLTMRITGGSDYVMRAYVDDLTGVTLMVLILFGPAEPVLPHTPEVCYPSSGYAKTDFSSNASIDYSPGKDSEGQPITKQALFRSSVYQKPLGRMVDREVVYHSFRLDGQWSPYIGAGKKFPRRNPGIFKIQVQRQVVEGESLGKNDPIEQFLGSLLTEIEKDINAAGGKAVASK